MTRRLLAKRVTIRFRLNLQWIISVLTIRFLLVKYLVTDNFEIGRLAQGESATLTRWRSVVRNHYRPPLKLLVRSLFASGFSYVWWEIVQKGRNLAGMIPRKSHKARIVSWKFWPITQSFPIYHIDPMKPNFVQLVMKTAINVDLMSSLDGYLKTDYGKSTIKTTSNRNRYVGVTQFLVL